MAYKCDLCFKGIEVGRSHRHHPGVAGARWRRRAPKTRRVFKPNLHVARVTIHGVRKRVRLCTKCLRKVKAQMKSAQVEKSSVVSQPLASNF